MQPEIPSCLSASLCHRFAWKAIGMLCVYICICALLLYVFDRLWPLRYTALDSYRKVASRTNLCPTGNGYWQDVDKLSCCWVLGMVGCLLPNAHIYYVYTHAYVLIEHVYNIMFVHGETTSAERIWFVRRPWRQTQWGQPAQLESHSSSQHHSLRTHM